jgi:hypothetical protein
MPKKLLAFARFGAKGDRSSALGVDSMLVDNVAAVRDTVVVVVAYWPQTDPATAQETISTVAIGTACYVGKDLFVTASHLFDNPLPDQKYLLLAVPNNHAKAARVVHPNALVEVALPAQGGPDLAIMRAAGVADRLPSVKVDCNDVPDGRSVYSYGYPNPVMSFTATGPIMSLYARVCPSMIAAHRRNKYLMDGSTYPGESGAPVFRSSDNVMVGVVQASQLMEVPAPVPPSASPGPPKYMRVRGPTVAGPLGPIAGELVSRGVTLL